MNQSAPVIIWFRQDLRLADNPALDAAFSLGAPVMPVYILDDESAAEWAMGGASRWWLHQSLASLNSSLDGGLRMARGRAQKVLEQLVAETGANAVFWNRCYEPWRIARDTQIKAALQAKGVAVESRNGSLLFEPPRVNKLDGTPYKVFTPFYRKGCLGQRSTLRSLIPPATELSLHTDKPAAAALSLSELELMPRVDWYAEMAAEWQPGEAGAQRRLQEFLSSGIRRYKDGRNIPAEFFVSRLSPHLHFGEVSPHQVWYAAEELFNDRELSGDVDHFLSELGWREFSYYLLYHNPDLPQRNLQKKFDAFPWREDGAALRAWQLGQTGIPIVDAGMRELWRTGFMHNRVRMIVASFLIKNLMLHWHHGERWFWDTLLDADLASNAASWQWVAGTGADAAPYFRIFNPVSQGQKFDGDGRYTRRYVPELAALPDKYLHCPWEAPTEVLSAAGVELGNTYPLPVADLKTTRVRALDAFKSLSTPR